MFKYFCRKSGLLLLYPFIFVALLCYRSQTKSSKDEVFKSPNISSFNVKKLNDVKLYSEETSLTPTLYSETSLTPTFYSEETSVTATLTTDETEETTTLYSEETSVTSSLYSEETLVTTTLTTDERQFREWLEKKDALKRNVERVCKKYGKSLSMDIKMDMFMYESEHKILFCRNAKVGK